MRMYSFLADANHNKSEKKIHKGNVRESLEQCEPHSTLLASAAAIAKAAGLHLQQAPKANSEIPENNHEASHDCKCMRVKFQVLLRTSGMEYLVSFFLSFSRSANLLHHAHMNWPVSEQNTEGRPKSGGLRQPSNSGDILLRSLLAYNTPCLACFRTNDEKASDVNAKKKEYQLTERCLSAVDLNSREPPCVSQVAACASRF